MNFSAINFAGASEAGGVAGLARRAPMSESVPLLRRLSSGTWGTGGNRAVPRAPAAAIYPAVPAREGGREGGTGRVAALGAAAAGASRPARAHTCRRAAAGRRPRSAPLRSLARCRLARRRHGGRGGRWRWGQREKTPKVWQSSYPAPRASRQRGRGVAAPPTARGEAAGPGVAGRVGGSRGGASAGRGGCAGG